MVNRQTLNRWSAIWAVFFLLAPLSPLRAEDPVVETGSASLAGPVMLEVTGRILRSNGEDDRGRPVYRFDREALMALPQARIETHTGWTEGRQTFDGVPLAALIDHVGVDGSVIRAMAINDYYAEIPITDLADHEILIAHTWNGERMQVRDRGPLWIIYSMSSKSGMRASLDNRKMVWQLYQLHISGE